MNKYADLLGRILMVLIFVLAGFTKIMHYDATAADMVAHGIPGMLLPVVIATELLGGLAIILGWQTRIAAFLLAGFSVVTALLMHNDPNSQVEGIMLMKNLSIAGGFLVIFANGAGPLSMDRRWGKA
jgi:putative oxidoreductase